MAQTLAIVVGAEIDDSHRQYPGLLSQGIVAESCLSATPAPPRQPQRILLRRLRQGRLRHPPPRALLTLEALLRVGLSSAAKVLDLNVGSAAAGAEGRSGLSFR
jgi:hypothetical protein